MHKTVLLVSVLCSAVIASRTLWNDIATCFLLISATGLDAVAVCKAENSAA